MTPEQDFLIKEYELSIKSGQWLEESIERHFKNLCVVFVWNMILVGLLLRNDLICGDLWNSLKSYHAKELIIIPSSFVLLYSYITVVNMLKARAGDVERTSRANFIRGYFLESMPDPFKSIYFNDARLSGINSTDIYKRPAWSWTSDVALYVIVTGFLSTVLVAILWTLFFATSMPCLISILALHVFGIIVFSRLRLRKMIPMKTPQKDKKPQMQKPPNNGTNGRLKT